MTDRITRRTFVSNMASTAFGFTIVPRHVLGRGFQAPSDTVNVAIVGAGGMGMSNTQNVVDGKQNIVAIADVDFGVVDRALAGRMRNPTPQSTALSEAHRKAKRHADFRRMLDAERDIDAVLVATPDHTHAIVAKRAMVSNPGRSPLRGAPR